MYDYEKAVQSKIEFYNQPRFLNDQFHPAGFKGTWNFSNHNLIPDIFHGFLQRHFGHYRIRRIPLTDINNLLNELWDGPGSLEKIFRLEEDLRASGKDVKFTATDVAIMKSKKVKDEDDLPISDVGIFDSIGNDYED